VRAHKQIAARVRALIVTRGGEGSHIYADGVRHEIPAARPQRISDPTGCGDAYRAGLLYGLQNGLDWPTTGRIASLMGSIKIEQHGTQNHRFGKEEFAVRYREAFGIAL
jgi:adenosine kinase